MFIPELPTTNSTIKLLSLAFTIQGCNTIVGCTGMERKSTTIADLKVREILPGDIVMVGKSQVLWMIIKNERVGTYTRLTYYCLNDGHSFYQLLYSDLEYSYDVLRNGELIGKRQFRIMEFKG